MTAGRSAPAHHASAEAHLPSWSSGELSVRSTSLSNKAIIRTQEYTTAIYKKRNIIDGDGKVPRFRPFGASITSSAGGSESSSSFNTPL